MGVLAVATLAVYLAHDPPVRDLLRGRRWRVFDGDIALVVAHACLPRVKYTPMESPVNSPAPGSPGSGRPERGRLGPASPAGESRPEGRHLGLGPSPGQLGVVHPAISSRQAGGVGSHRVDAALTEVCRRN